MRRRCGVIETGCVSYDHGLAVQRQARALVETGEWDGIVILLEHQPVISIGRGGGTDNLRVTENQLLADGIDLVRTDRGGNITCHNPGQLVGYPILNLHRWQRDIHWYVHALEDVIIKSLSCYQLRTGRKMRYRGVWLGDGKIAAIGVLVRRWITGHGFAVNVNNQLDLFGSIVPCGIREFGVTSMLEAGVDVDLVSVKNSIKMQFQQQFDCDMTEIGGLGSYSPDEPLAEDQN